MAIKLDTFSSAGGGAGTDNLDDVTSRGATTTNAITVGGVTVGTEYTLPSADGSTNQYLKTDGAGNLSFADLDITGGLTYQGAFNATAGTPDISNAEKGDFYVIDTAGTIYGQTWAVGDHLLVNEDMGGTITNSKIDKIDNTDQVTSVNGNTGAVVLSGDDLAADHTATNYTAANANIDGHLSGIDTKLGTVASPTLDDVTTNGNTTTNTIEVGQVTVSGDILASSADSRTIGEEDTRFITYYGDMNGAIRFKAKNDQGAQITKGQAVYIKGLAGDGTTPTVGLADADDATKMPAFGLAFNTANDQAEVQIVSFGNLGGLNTSTYSVGDTLYIDTTAGGLVNTKPTGETAQLQNIGRVIRSNNGDGIIMVGGAGRSAATPNLNDGKIFLGNASNQSVSTAISSIALSSFNDDLSYLSSGDNVSLLTNDAGYLTNINSESIDDLSDVNLTSPSSGQVLSYNGTNWINSAASAGSLAGLSDTTITSPANGEVLKYNGSSWVDVQLAYSELSGTPTNVSTFTNDAGYLTNINSESIDDLSDVTITAAANGEVLKYNGSAWVDAQLAYSELSGTPTNVSTFTNDAGYLTNINSESINDLSDVVLTTPSSGQVLSYNGANWVNAAASGGGGYTYSAITADPSNAQANYHYSCIGTFTITLPTSGVTAGEEIRIKNMGTGIITIDPQTQNIDGSTTDYTLTVQYSSITLVSTGAHWEVV